MSFQHPPDTVFSLSLRDASFCSLAAWNPQRKSLTQLLWLSPGPLQLQPDLPRPNVEHGQKQLIGAGALNSSGLWLANRNSHQGHSVCLIVISDERRNDISVVWRKHAVLILPLCSACEWLMGRARAALGVCLPEALTRRKAMANTYMSLLYS